MLHMYIFPFFTDIVFQEMTMPASPSTIINSSSNPNNEANELRNLVKELEEEIRSGKLCFTFLYYLNNSVYSKFRRT
jgi:hypothetical protein